VRKSLRELRIAKGEKRIQLLEKIIFPFLRDYRMMNPSEFEEFTRMLQSEEPTERQRIWRNIVELYQYTKNAVKKKKLKKGELPGGSDG
jgi:hypothetical protein